MKNPFLIGDRVYLRPLVESDIDAGYLSWLNDPEVCRHNSHHVYPYTRESAVDFVRAVSKDKSQLTVAACLKEDDRHIGNVSLQTIHLVNRSAEFAILFGDRTAWGKGYSKEAAALLVRHGFLELGLNRVHCGTSAENIPMQKLAAFMGMKEEGRRRQALFKNGAFQDVLEYGVLREDFLKKFP